MPTLIAEPTRIEAAGTLPKLIDEYVGRLNSKTDGVSIAHMRSPAGWTEPRQQPEFDEYTLVLAGTLRISDFNFAGLVTSNAVVNVTGTVDNAGGAFSINAVTSTWRSRISRGEPRLERIDPPTPGMAS